MSTNETIHLSEARDWLASHGYTPPSYQALHKAVLRGWLHTARSERIGGQTYRWVRTSDLRAYADRSKSRQKKSRKSRRGG